MTRLSIAQRETLGTLLKRPTSLQEPGVDLDKFLHPDWHPKLEKVSPHDRSLKGHVIVYPVRGKPGKFAVRTRSEGWLELPLWKAKASRWTSLKTI